MSSNVRLCLRTDVLRYRSVRALDHELATWNCQMHLHGLSGRALNWSCWQGRGGHDRCPRFFLEAHTATHSPAVSRSLILYAALSFRSVLFVCCLFTPLPVHYHHPHPPERLIQQQQPLPSPPRLYPTSPPAPAPSSSTHAK